MHVHTDDLGGWDLERSQSGPDDYAAFKVQAEQTTCWLDAVEHRGFAAGAALALAEAAEAGGDQTMASFWANEAALMGHDALAALSDHCSFHEAEELEQCPGCSSARIAQALFVAGVAFEANGEDDAAITASEHAVRALAAAGPCADRSRVVEAPRVAAAVMRARGRFD
ncbi:MAG: hypothetical protein OEY23_22980, partial [Acidimicrobiia bacterium]|nr:hypothetical protein [Acidimicrobiia bacterium]